MNTITMTWRGLRNACRNSCHAKICRQSTCPIWRRAERRQGGHALVIRNSWPKNWKPTKPGKKPGSWRKYMDKGYVMLGKG